MRIRETPRFATVLSDPNPFVRCLLGLMPLLLCAHWAAGQTRFLHGNDPAAAAHLQPIGRLAATNELSLSIGLPLRDPAGLKKFLRDVYNPASSRYRKYVTPNEFAASWGPIRYEKVRRGEYEQLSCGGEESMFDMRFLNESHASLG